MLFMCLPVVMALSQPGGARDTLLKQATAYWKLNNAVPSDKYPLRAQGQMERDAPIEETGANIGGKAVRLSNAYFDAGTTLPVNHAALTVYLRARDPRGIWTYGLFNKRDTHQTCSFNLFSVDLPPTPGPDIGFELHTEAGLVAAYFPVSRIAPTAWHDFVGSYDGHFVSLYCDGKLMSRRAWYGQTSSNNAPILIGAETDHGQIARPFTGEMEEAALWQRSLNDTELAVLMRKEKIMPDAAYVAPVPPPPSPVHYRPQFARLADTIPFFWKGEYHIFYLRAVDHVPWEHIVSKDLIHWKELPTALVADGAPDGPDGRHMFTGSVIEHDGVFHIYYTGWNNENPRGQEFMMHATSPDLIHWTKQPQDILAPDGKIYSNARLRDFRDPYLFRNPATNDFMMFFCSGAHTGVASSPDLVHWTQRPPIESDYTGLGTPECPDTFQIGSTHYLITSPTATQSTIARYSENLLGPYQDPLSRAIDTPILYAAKRMYNGKRHILTGWLRDLDGGTDTGSFLWGGTQSIPREITAGPDGQLLFHPIPAAVAAYKHPLWNLTEKPTLTAIQGQWQYIGKTLEGAASSEEAYCMLETPPDYLLRCKVKLNIDSNFSLGFREGDKANSGYRLRIRPWTQEAEISSAHFHYPRRILLDTTKPVTIQAFVQGDIIECFINNAFAFSCRAYNARSGKLGLHILDGKAQIQELSVKLSDVKPATGL